MTNPPQQRRRKEARPGEIGDAALELFIEKGFAATRLDDVAIRAGVSKGTIYLYFESKETLFKEAIETAMMPAIEAAEALANDAGTPAAELLRRFIEGWWCMVGSTTLGGLPKLLVAEAGNFPEIAHWFHESMIRRAQKAMARIIDLGIERGEFRAVDSDISARVFFGPMFSYVVWSRAFGPAMCELPTPEQFFATTLDLLIEGLAQSPSQSPSPQESAS